MIDIMFPLVSSPSLGDNEKAWFIGNLSEIFKETITGVSAQVLQSELKVCKELLDLEPDNKCENYSCTTIQSHNWKHYSNCR